MRAFVVSVILSVLVAPVLAAEAAASAPAAAASGAAAQKVDVVAQPRTVCHRELPTGSTIPHTVCHTESPGDDAQRAQTQQELADEAQRNRMISVGGRPNHQ